MLGLSTNVLFIIERYLSIGSIWKIALIVFFLLVLLVRTAKLKSLTKDLYPLLFLIVFVNSRLLDINIIISDVKYILSYLIPFIIFYLLEVFNVSRKSAHAYLLSVLFFASIISLLQLAGILPSLHIQNNFDLLDTNGFSGPFQNLSGASKFFVLGLAYVVVIPMKEHSFLKAFLILTLALAVYGSYTRTAWLMTLFSSGYYLWFSFREKGKGRFKKVFVLVMGMLVVSYFVDMELVFNRFTDHKEANSHSNWDKFNDISSGRLALYLTSFEIFSEYNWLHRLIGIGREPVLSLIERDYGVRLYPHSKLIEVVLVGGLLSLYAFYKFWSDFMSRIVDKLTKRNFILLLLISVIPSHGFGLYGGLILGVMVFIFRYNEVHIGSNKISG